MVARQAAEQVMDLRYTLRMMGIPIDGPSWCFGDNQSVIVSSTIPQSMLNKRHNALSYHRVRECIANETIYFMHIDGKTNPSDVLTKFLGWSQFWPLIQPLLFWKGETMKNVIETTPVANIIKDLQKTNSSELWGVTSSNCTVAYTNSHSKLDYTKRHSNIYYDVINNKDNGINSIEITRMTPRVTDA
jgi:hypothetical protein